MKKRVLIQVIMFISLFNYFLSTNVAGITYEMEVDIGDEFIWRVDTYDEGVYVQYSSIPEFTEGSQKKHEIIGIIDNDSYWVVTYKVWDYMENADELLGDHDGEEKVNVYKDPKDFANATFTLDGILNMWVIPVPYTNYLSEFRDNFNKTQINIKVADNGLLLKYAWTHLDYEIEIAYTLDGVIDKIEYRQITNDYIFVSITLHREVSISVSGYAQFLIPLTIITIGLVLVLKKKIRYCFKS